MSFENPLFLIPFLVGIIFVIAGIITYKYPPKKINYLYGYRTRTSMRSQERWDFSQRYASKQSVYGGFGMIIIALLASFIKTSLTLSVVLGILIMCLAIGVLIYNTEAAIKQRFDNN